MIAADSAPSSASPLPRVPEGTSRTLSLALSLFLSLTLSHSLSLPLLRAAAIAQRQVNNCSGGAELFGVSVLPVNVSVFCPSLCWAPFCDWKSSPAANIATVSRVISLDLTKCWFVIHVVALFLLDLQSCLTPTPTPTPNASYMSITTHGVVLLKEWSSQYWNSNHLLLAGFSWEALVTFSNPSDLFRVSQRWGSETDHQSNHPPAFSEVKCCTFLY